jgi:hypothetical protein
VTEPTVPQLQNAMRWIHHVAALHYFGGAFDPQHMRALANMAADALDGREFKDYDATIDEAKVRAREMRATFCLEAADEPAVLAGYTQTAREGR